MAGETKSAVDKRGERVRNMFAGIAKRYDLLNHVLSLNIDKRWRRATVQATLPVGAEPILDVCTGTGDLAFAYRDAVGGRAPVVGSDFCREMLVVARDKDCGRSHPVTFVEADALQLPFPENAFQLVSVAFGLRNVADTRGGIAELVRVAKPGGRVVILEFSRPRIPILRSLYLAYFKYLLPRIGQSLSKSKDDAYHYLPASVLEFPDGQELCQLLAEHGLRNVTAKPLTFGIATLYVGEKA